MHQDPQREMAKGKEATEEWKESFYYGKQGHMAVCDR